MCGEAQPIMYFVTSQYPLSSSMIRAMNVGVRGWHKGGQGGLELLHSAERGHAPHSIQDSQKTNSIKTRTSWMVELSGGH